MRANGPTATELERAQNMFESSIIRGLETLGGFGGVADRLNQYNHHLKDPGYLARDLDRYRKATAADLKLVAQKKLTRQSRVLIHAVPGKKVIEDVPRAAQTGAKDAGAPAAPAPPVEKAEEDWRKKPPAPGPASQLSLPVPKTFKLANGLSVYFVERHKLPIVAANLVVLAGSETNPPKLPGLAAFTAGMLDEGTNRRSALQIADDADQLGATLTTGSSQDLAFVAVRSLKKTSERALELMAEVALHPEFPAHEIERLRKERQTQLLQQRDSPGALAARVLYGAIYGPEHPYGYTEIGTEESLKSIGRDDMLRFWKAGFAPQNAALVVAGDMTDAELHALAEKYFGQWSGQPSVTRPPEPADVKERRVIIVDKPGAPQTTLYVGHVGIAHQNPDYVAADVMNTGLGGLFSSRINLNLREKHGYTYGASSVLAARRGRGPFLVGTGVRTEVTADSVREIFGELERMRTAPFSVEELATAKDSIARSLPGLFETTPQTASSIGQLYVLDLPLDYYSSLPGKVAAVGPQEVIQVAQRYLHPDAAVVVAVGDRKTIEPGLRKLALGPVEVRDRDGKPVK
jgi:zinc protease